MKWCKKRYYPCTRILMCSMQSMIRNAVEDENYKTVDKSVIYIIHFVKHKCDPDNYTTKFIIDAFNHLNFIPDDSMDHITVVAKAKYDPEESRTEIHILEDKGQLNLLESSLKYKKDLTANRGL